jgi:ATP-binding cassette subfamily B protein
MQKEYNGLKKIVDLVKLERKEISAIYFYAVLSGLIQLILPLGIQSILGFVLGSVLVTSVYVLISVIILGVIIIGYLQINQMKIIEKIQQKIFVRYAFAFAESIPRFSLKEIDKYYMPEKINRFFDSLNVQKGISKLLLEIPAASIQILFGLVLLSIYHPLFIIFSLLLVIVICFIFYFTSKMGLATSVNESDNKYKVAAWLQEMGRVVKSIKLSQGTHLNLIRTDEKTVKYLNARSSHFNVLLFQFKSLVFFKICTTALMLFLGTFLLFNQSINIGQFVATEIIILTIINSAEKLITSLEVIYDVVTGLIKLDSVLDNPFESEGNFKLTSNTIEIACTKMSFSYNESQEIFKDVNVFIPAKSITCISGEENSGKSTFLKLLTASYSDFEGSISINNIHLQNYSLASLRSKMGILLYDQDLFEGTLFDNITLGRSTIGFDSILELAKKLGFENFIQSFPKNFATQIEPLGHKLPSTLIRKILLLRALINEPVLLLLEEPWMGLDKQIQTQIQNYLITIAKNVTIVIATNDNDFINKCSNHYHIENGTIN